MLRVITSPLVRAVTDVDACGATRGCHTDGAVASNTGRMRQCLRYTGVAAVVTIWTTLTAAAAVADFDVLGAEPISQLGTEGAATALFGVGLAVSALLFTAFHQYLRGRYAVGPGFSLAMLTGLAGQMVAAFVPIGGAPAVHRIHTTSALVLGASLPLLMWRFAAGQPPGPWRRLAYRLFWAEVGACAVGVYLSARTVASVAEILPAAVFHTWVLVVTFATAPTPDPVIRETHLIRRSPKTSLRRSLMERSTRIAAGVFVIVGGLVHLELWRSGYRAIPYIGPWFIANVAVSAVVAVAIVLRSIPAVKLAGIALSVTSLAALVMSRTVGIFGFTEREWTDEAVRATTAEIGAIVAFAVLLVAFRMPRPAPLCTVPVLNRDARA